MTHVAIPALRGTLAAALVLGFVAVLPGTADARWQAGECAQALREKLTKDNGLAAWTAHCINWPGEPKRFGLLVRHNNPPARRHLVVLVHGWRGDPITTWGKLPEIFFNAGLHPNASVWTDKFDLVTYGYETGIGAGDDLNTEAARLADLLADLATAGRFRANNQNLAYDNILIIAHSMGGLIVQRAALMMLSDARRVIFANNVRGVIHIAVPNDIPKVFTSEGTKFARWATRLYGGGNHVQALQPYSAFRDALSRAWAEFSQRETDRFRLFILDRTGLIRAEKDDWVDDRTMVERFKDGGRPGVRIYEAYGQDHSGAVAISSTIHPTFYGITDFVRQFVRNIDETTRPRFEVLPHPFYMAQRRKNYFLIYNASPMVLDWYVHDQSSSVTDVYPKRDQLHARKVSKVDFEAQVPSQGEQFIVIGSQRGDPRRLRLVTQPPHPMTRVLIGCFDNPNKDPEITRWGLDKEIRERLEIGLQGPKREIIDPGDYDINVCDEAWRPDWLRVAVSAVVVHGSVERRPTPGGSGAEPRYVVNFFVRAPASMQRGTIVAGDPGGLLAGMNGLITKISEFLPQ